MNAADRLWISWFEPVEHKYPERTAPRTTDNTSREEARRMRQAARARQKQADKIAGVR